MHRNLKYGRSYARENRTNQQCGKCPFEGGDAEFIFLGAGMLFTLRTGFFQFKGWKVWMGDTLGALFRDRRVRKAQDHQSISQFQSFCTALAVTCGTGNITGLPAIVTRVGRQSSGCGVSAFLADDGNHDRKMCSGLNIITKTRRCMG